MTGKYASKTVVWSGANVFHNGCKVVVVRKPKSPAVLFFKLINSLISSDPLTTTPAFSARRTARRLASEKRLKIVVSDVVKSMRIVLVGRYGSFKGLNFTSFLSC